MGLLGSLFTLVAVLLVGAAGTGAYLYATDYTLKADVLGKSCKGSAPDDQNVVDIKTRQFGIEHAVAGIPDRECTLLQKGDYVEYRIRSERTTLYNSDGRCLYDTETGVGCTGAGGLL
jgi:hypothetical protein